MVSRAGRQWLVLPGQWWNWTEHRASLFGLMANLYSHCWWDIFNFGGHISRQWHDCGIRFPDQGSNPHPLHRKHGVFTSGSPGEFLQDILWGQEAGRPGMVDASSQGRKSKEAFPELSRLLFVCSTEGCHECGRHFILSQRRFPVGNDSFAFVLRVYTAQYLGTFQMLLGWWWGWAVTDIQWAETRTERS